MGGKVPVIARPDRPQTGFVGAHFPPATGSPVHGIRPSARPAPLVFCFHLLVLKEELVFSG